MLDCNSTCVSILQEKELDFKHNLKPEKYTKNKWPIYNKVQESVRIDKQLEKRFGFNHRHAKHNRL